MIIVSLPNSCFPVSTCYHYVSACYHDVFTCFRLLPLCYLLLSLRFHLFSAPTLSSKMTITIRRNPEFTNLLQKNLNKRYEERRRLGDSCIHVSDILPTNCIRKQYYSRFQKSTLSQMNQFIIL